MTSYKRYIPQPVPIRGAGAASVFTVYMVRRLRSMQKERAKTALADWDDEGGHVAAAAPCLDRDTRGQ